MAYAPSHIDVVDQHVGHAYGQARRQGRIPSTNRLDIVRLVRARLVGKKRLPLIIVTLVMALLLIIFLRNYSSKTAQEDRQSLDSATSTITQKLEQAEDVFELNSGRSVALLTESKQDLKSLEKTAQRA